MQYQYQYQYLHLGLGNTNTYFNTRYFYFRYQYQYQYRYPTLGLTIPIPVPILNILLSISIPIPSTIILGTRNSTASTVNATTVDAVLGDQVVQREITSKDTSLSSDPKQNATNLRVPPFLELPAMKEISQVQDERNTTKSTSETPLTVQPPKISPTASRNITLVPERATEIAANVMNGTEDTFVDTTSDRGLMEQAEPTVENKPAINNVCQSSICQQASGELQSSLNERECADIEKYVCSSAADSDIPAYASSWGFLEKAEEDRLWLIDRLFTQSLPDLESWTPFQLASKVHKACMDVGKIEKVSKSSWTKFSDELGGLPIAMHFFRESAYDWNKANAKINQVLGKGSIVEVRVENGLANTKIVRLEVGVGASDLPPEEFLHYEKNQPLFQAWVELFYKSMEELWENDMDLLKG